MNLRPAFFSPALRAVLPVLWGLVLASSGVAAAATARVDKSDKLDRTDEAVLQVRDAFRVGNAATMARAAAQARGHVLEPYVEYWQLRHRLEDRSAEEVRAFLALQEGSYLAERLRADWLKVLGKKGDWEGFRSQRSLLVNDDPDIVCLGLLGRFIAGDVGTVPELKPQWLAPRELPEACGQMVDQLQRNGQYGSSQVWERFRVLIEAGQNVAARRALTMLPAREQPSTALLDRALNAPAKFLLQQPDVAGTRTARELVILALMRLARSDPADAAARWNESLRAGFSAADQAFVWGQIALWGARRHLPEALGWFALAANAPLSDEQLAWHTRIAMRTGAWPEVRAAIEKMSPQARLDTTWVYWHARALRETGAAEQARAEFARIAGEYSFYGQLAAEEQGVAFRLPPQAAPASTEELARVKAIPGLQRAMALFRLDLRTEAVREWNWSLRGMDDRQLIAASELAKRNEIWDRAINTADRTVMQHDFALRYLAPYHQVFAGQAKAQQLEEHWVLGLVRQESRFISNAKSGAGAAGLMQLMPATARWVAHKMGMKDFHWSKVSTVEVNAALGSFYLRTVLDDLDGQPVLASAAYNAGPGRARRWQDARPLEGAIYAESIPFDETRDYVKKVMTNAMYYAAVHGGNPRSLRERLGVIGARGRPSNGDIP